MEKTEFAVAIGERLHKLREASGQSAEVFAAVGGVSRTAQFAYERGSTIPDAHYLQAIAEAQAVGLQWLITGDQVFGAAGITTEEEKVVERYRALPKRLRDIVDGVLLLAWLAADSRRSYHQDEQTGNG